MRSGLPRLRLALAAGLLALLGGCASVPANPTAANPADPWENWNRKVYSFNDKVDEAVLKPVATAYRDTVPELVRTGIGNVLGNIGDVWSTANHFLQGKFQSGLEMGMRVLTNSVFGLGGLLDPATPMGLTRRSEDFGQTLGRWGVGGGPFVMLPLLGPSTVRDTAGWVVDRPASPSNLPPTATGRNSLTAISVIDLRANLLSTTKLLDSVALDRYSFVRDAYLQRRLDQVYDGAPPMEDFGDDPLDTPAPAAAAASAPARPAARPASR
ncbi:ABC transporter [Rubrivivax sp. A210]|uniref:MlaA family lipoprotein n=1 Tax=Rubrivivax sp. A210 TaxID=2772301 RepID=UPI001992BBC9|nr:VacJ family lipoprotein [Rubrivivax sp. A210]CAD5372605.1 ABC transporter [Rubrivivax sp. A210]